ncbi:hypothetical protein ACFLV0_05420 [Chloroflexota bacterium]
MPENKVIQIQGILVIVARRNFKGLAHWIEELARREIPAVIQVDESTIAEHCHVLKEFTGKRFEFGGAYNERPFWDEPFGRQYEIMRGMKDKLEACLNKPMRVFQSMYMAYNEATLQAADKLGIEFILARGASGASAVVYQPLEYQVKIISASNVPSKDMGSGSLCDHSLWCRTETPASFRDILFALKEDRIILVAQAYLSGIKLRWWNVYQDFLNADIVAWKTLDEFATIFELRPNAQIQVNTEVDYTTPKPKIPLEQEPNYPFEQQK